MVIVYTYCGIAGKELLRQTAVKEYNSFVRTYEDVSLFYDKGIPYLTGDKHISIAHTELASNKRIELIAIGDGSVGIDIEDMGRHCDFIGVAKRYFDTRECEYIGESKERFMEIWCRKEAYGKSLKKGLIRQNVLDIPYFHSFDIFNGYKVVLYSEDKDILFCPLTLGL